MKDFFTTVGTILVMGLLLLAPTIAAYVTYNFVTWFQYPWPGTYTNEARGMVVIIQFFWLLVLAPAILGG